MAKRKRGRRVGTRNRGYFYRTGRGWYSKINGRFVPLTFENGERMPSESTPITEVKAAYYRLMANGEEATAVDANAAPECPVTVLEVCTAYLSKAKNDGAAKTHHDRADTLFDFCFGLRPEFRAKDDKPARQATANDYIHDGYGALQVARLLPLHIDQWLQKHPTWGGGKRARVQAVKRALNYGVESGLIPANPIRGYKVAKQNARVTYLTPEQESALCAAANPVLSAAIQVCIRTGARPGCEFAALTAKHVKDHGERMELVFQPAESKTKRLRTIRITDADTIATVRRQIEQHPTGPIFRNTKGDPWKPKNLSLAFRSLKKRLIKSGLVFDNDACIYSCRHTYAKRALQGFWTGKATNIETLARLMGNSPQVCRDHYLQWCDSYSEPLWESA